MPAKSDIWKVNSSPLVNAQALYYLYYMVLGAFMPVIQVT
jgi:hypothetical protein